MQLVYTVSKPTSRGLSAGGAACLYGFKTYLQGTVCCRCSLFIRFPNLPAGDCLLKVTLVYTVSKPTSRGLSTEGAACLYGFKTYLQGTVCCRCSLFICFPTYLQGTGLLEYSLFIRFQTYLQGTVCWRCSLFIRFQNLPAGDCLL